MELKKYSISKKWLKKQDQVNLGKPVRHDIYHEITITLQSKAKEKRSSIPNKPNVAKKIKKRKSM